MKIKKILIIGLGSIGKKHTQVLKKINNKIKVFRIIKNDSISYMNKLIDKNRLKLALISSPADTHLKYMNFLKKKKINYLVEKPIIKDNQLKLFQRTYDKKSNIIELVGYQLRFSKILNKLKKVLISGKIGKIYNIRIFVNSYLPNWRKANFKNSLSISKKKGGGVLLELSHEIDYMVWLFGKPKYLKAIIDKNNIFKKNIEEKVCIFFYYPQKTIQMDMSFNSRIEERGMIINALKGSLKVDLIKKRITYYQNNQSKELYKSNQNNFDMLNEQMNFFLNLVKNNRKKNDIKKSIEIIRIISLIKKSNFSNKKIRV